MRLLTTLQLTLVLLCAVSQAQVPFQANDYPQWRGPHRDGISLDQGLLQQWPEEGPKVAWEIKDVGVGYSSVAIKDGLIVTMGDLNGVEHIIAVDADNGQRVWAVQPQPVADALAEKVDAELQSMDLDRDGTVSELEALRRLGWSFYKYDQDAELKGLQSRVADIVASLDKDADQQLSVSEAGGVFKEQFIEIDSSDPAKTESLALSRSENLISKADKDADGQVTKKEARGTPLDRVFGKADRKDRQTRQADGVLTEAELIAYFSKREPGKDGILTTEELENYYRSHVVKGNGLLSQEELRQHLGGYRNNQGDGPRGTPTIDGQWVYAEGANGDLTCLELSTGKTRWHINLQTDLGGRRPGWGYSESPLIVGDMVIVTPGGSQGTVAALNKNTGDVLWRSEEVTEAAHYASPIVTSIGGIEQVVQFARESAFGVTLGGGKLLWKYSGANNGTANCCTPIVENDHVFVASAYGTGGGLAKIQTDGQKQTATEEYFEKKMAIHHGGIVKIGDFMYSNGAGSLICINFLTGEIAWQDRSVGKGSLTAADGLLYVLGERQQLALVRATPERYEELGRIELPSYGRPSWAHPVVAGGKLYVRDQHSLTAFQVR